MSSRVALSDNWLVDSVEELLLMEERLAWELDGERSRFEASAWGICPVECADFNVDGCGLLKS